MVNDMMKYPGFKNSLSRWRQRLDEAVDNDKVLMKNEEHGDHPSLGARTRALGYTSNVSDEKLAKIIVELDEYYKQSVIHFVGYNEDIYNYVKGGITNKAADGSKAENGNNARASDWYAFYDQQVGY